MYKVGDRVVVDGRKVGQARRGGVITTVNGAMVTVQWEDGHTTSFVPSAGSMSVVGSGAGTAIR
jgi:hypothetical protein